MLKGWLARCTRVDTHEAGGCYRIGRGVFSGQAASQGTTGPPFASLTRRRPRGQRTRLRDPDTQQVLHVISDELNCFYRHFGWRRLRGVTAGNSGERLVTGHLYFNFGFQKSCLLDKKFS